MNLILKAAYQDLIRLGKDERGVAFVLTLGVFLFMFLLCMGVYAVGDTVRQKIELQNAADAAAYSAAVVQADTLSRIATINRAMSWTYIQMTKRQMDFIVDKWLERTCTVFEEDLRNVWSWNKMSFFNCRSKHNTAKDGLRASRSDTFWCGQNADDGHCKIKLNGFPGIDVDIDVIKSAVAASKIWTGDQVLTSGNPLAIVTGSESLGAQILVDKVNINAMNAVEVDLVLELPNRISKTVRDVLKANLPDELVKNDFYQYSLYQNKTPITYFDVLNNTKDDELTFLSFAYDFDKVSSSVLKSVEEFNTYLYDSLRDNQDSLTALLGSFLAGGLDRWFVRGNGARRASDRDTGLQRSYKMWAEDYLKSMHPTKATLPASCLNFNGDDNSSSNMFGGSFLRDGKLPSIGLCSEWKWYAMFWICTPRSFGRWRHRRILGKFDCPHHSFDLFTIRNGKNCTTIPTGDGFTGYSRVYGDDDIILQSHREKYVGAKCMPLILSPGFFGKLGSIVVGLSRKNTNPFSFFLDNVLGIFSAFDVSDRPSHMWAVSAARSGYRAVENGNGGIRFGERGQYRVDWTDPKDNRLTWNLKQPDWDAVFLPVQHAWDLCLNGVFVPDGGSGVLSEMMTGEWLELNDDSWFSLVDTTWNRLSAPSGMGTGNLDWDNLALQLMH